MKINDANPWDDEDYEEGLSCSVSYRDWDLRDQLKSKIEGCRFLQPCRISLVGCCCADFLFFFF